MRNILLRKLYTKCGEETSPELPRKNQLCAYI